MFELVIFVALICVTLLGFGGALCKALGGTDFQDFDSWTLPDMALLGIWIITLLALVANFFVGLSEWSGVWTISAGVTLAIIVFRDRLRLILSGTAWLIFGCSVIYFSARVIGSGITYDTGLYHIPLLSWMAESGTPFGLANLEGRLGFDSSWLIFNSAFRLPILGWGYLRGVECAIWVVATCFVLDGLFRRWTHFDSVNKALLVSIAFVSVIYSVLVGPVTVSSTDNAPNIFGIIAAVTFIEFCMAVRLADAAGQARAFLLLSALVALAVTGKLSLAPIIIFVVLGVGFAIQHKANMGFLLPAAIVFIVLIVSWCVRNIFLSGCLAYPVPQTCSDSLSWAVGSSSALDMRNEISASARGYGSSDWVMRGVILQRPTVVVGLLFLIGIYMTLRRYIYIHLSAPDALKKTPPILASYEGASIAAVSVIGVAFWFITAPAPRFCWSFLILSTVVLNANWCLTLGIAFINNVVHLVNTARHYWYLPLLLLLILFAVVRQAIHYPNLRDSFPVQTPPTRLMKSDITGFEARSPIEGDQCWDTTLPCTPYFERVLRLKMDTYLGRPIFTVIRG